MHRSPRKLPPHRHLVSTFMIVALLGASAILAAPALAEQSGDGPEEAMKVQIALAEAHFSPGPVDGMWGMNTRKALKAFQQANGLQASGELDDPSRKALNLDREEPWMVEYTLTEEDVAGPFVDEIPDKPADQAAMKSLAYTSVSEALAEKFRLDEDTLLKLASGTELEAGAKIRVPDLSQIPVPKAEGEVTVVVSKSADSLEVKDASGKVIFFAPATAGSDREPLPLGDWKVTAIAQDPTFHYNPELLLDADPNSEETTLPAGPNNPVGKVWIGIDKEHYGIHGTPEPAEIGRTASSGCVRLANWDVLQLVELVDAGTPVHFVE